MRALVVCHDRRVLQEVAKLLTDWGFDVTKCLDGRGACELIESGGKFDLMVAQLMLPYRDGWELTMLRRSQGFLANVLLTHQWNMITDGTMFEEARISALPVYAIHLEREVRLALLKVEPMDKT